MGLMDFMFSLGTLAAPFLVVVLYWWQEDWRWPVRLMALSLVGLAGYAFWLSRQQLELAGHSDTVRRSLSYRVVLKKPVFWALAFAMVTVVTVPSSGATATGLSVMPVQLYLLIPSRRGSSLHFLPAVWC